MHYVRIIDENGIFIQDAFVEYLSLRTVATPCPAGFFAPKWDGTQWIEGGKPPEPKNTTTWGEN